MIINISDSFNSMLQSIMFIYVSNYCSKTKRSILSIVTWIVILWGVIQGITLIVGNSSLGTIFIHLIILISGAIIFKEDPLDAMIGFSIVYFAVGIIMMVTSNIYLGCIVSMLPVQYLQLGMFIFIYLPQYILFAMILCNMNFIKSIYKVFKSKSISIISLIIVTVLIDFIVSFNGLAYDMDNPLFKEFLFIFLGFFMIGITIYFSNIEKKSNQVLIANSFLEKKNEELKKIKHDYGSQISYLYGLHLMKKYDKLGDALKNIINDNSAISSEVDVINKPNSSIADIVYGIEHKGINIIINDEIDLNDIDISEIDYQRVISNILRNAVTALNDKGIIEVTTYYAIRSVIVQIKNNGPKIDESIIDKIFDTGFTTKENQNKENGFGLSITKEIIERNNGNISVKSNDSFTEFKIKFPKREI
ncbi:sensor histidine kinase [uncultured Clostridium sp.]|uniref:sensor histidine kinase n=1 Tax=uncultured Clostridium sp. TaxID=59620 RepID=UPI002671A997|nr:ATP-binding protein [uncultured Clostridium sp.]